MRFWFHYNKPLSQQKKQTMLTFHFKGACHFVEDFVVHTAIKPFLRKRKTQPKCVIAGDCSNIVITDGVAHIY